VLGINPAGLADARCLRFIGSGFLGVPDSSATVNVLKNLTNYSLSRFRSRFESINTRGRRFAMVSPTF
jgi:hypothetical protein